MTIGERQNQTAKMLLLVATLVVSIASATAANSDSHVMQVQRYVNGNPVPQGMPLMSNEAAAAAVSALAGDFGQQAADDRSLKLIHKAIPLIALSKLKKKKNPLKKNPLKSPLPLLLGGAAATAAAASSGAGAGAAAAAAGSAGALPGLLRPATFTQAVPETIEMPVWKVHKYNGIDIRPVRFSELVQSPALPPPSEATGFQQIVSNVPKEVSVPEPISIPSFGTPADTYPSHADTITFPETPATSYGVPAQTYGPPAQTYGPPAQFYGVPQYYGAPTQGFSQSQQQPQPISFATGSEEVITNPTEEAATAEGLEALSNLGALTDFLPGGGDAGSRLPAIFNLMGAGGRNRGVDPFGFFNRFVRGPQPVVEAAEIPIQESTIFRQPQQSAIQNLLGRIPIISSLTSFGSNPSTHVSIPPLPELPAVPDIQNVRGANTPLPQIPHIRLPTKYVVQGSPYVSIRYPQSFSFRPQSVVGLPYTSGVNEPTTGVVESTNPAPEPVVEHVEPPKSETTYPLPLEEPQPQQPPQPQYGLINSYGQPVQTGYYVTPVIAAPAPPQFAVPYYSSPIPASQYGLPGGDAVVAASEIDAATVTECADGKQCAESVAKVAVPEGTTRAVNGAAIVVAPSPVFKKEEVAQVKDIVEDMTRYLDPEHPAATKTVPSPAVDKVDAKPSTATEEKSS